MARILLIEDNFDTRIVYSTILEHFGYEVTVATTGEEGLQLAGELLPDVVTIDISLPGINGL